MKTDGYFMRRALKLAKKGFPNALPNPLVGCVIVKNGKIIGQGFHESFGSSHAEINAIKKIPVNQCEGATLYVTLEPCSHFGKTPPCISRVLKAGIKRVYISMPDPNIKVSGSGIRALKKAGIKVFVGLLRHESELLNETYIKNNESGSQYPFVALKMGMSMDGKIATKTGNSKWITSEASREYVKTIRDDYDAILVGKNTVLRDNPRLLGRKSEPIRIILDSKFESSANSNVFRNKRAILITTNRAKHSKLESISKKGIIIKKFYSSIQIDPVLRYLKTIGINRLFVEGGSEIFGSFADAKKIDKIYLFIAPKIIGGRQAKSGIAGNGVALLRNSMNFELQKIKKIGKDVLFIYFARGI